MKNPQHKVTVNQGSVREFAANGAQSQIEVLYRLTAEAVKRLKLIPAKAFRRQPRFEGGKPSTHDILRWLNDLSEESSKEDLFFLRQLHATLRSRVRQVVIDEVGA